MPYRNLKIQDFGLPQLTVCLIGHGCARLKISLKDHRGLQLSLGHANAKEGVDINGRVLNANVS